MNEITTREKLRNMNNKELKALILDLAKLRKENTEWLQAKLKGEECIDETLAYYKKKIKNSLQLEIINLSEAKKAIADFKKISKKPEYILELMLFYVETGIEIENEFGDMYETFYASMESVFDNIIRTLNANTDLIPVYKERLTLIVDRSSEGWGHKDSLSDILNNLDLKEHDARIIQKQT